LCQLTYIFQGDTTVDMLKALVAHIPKTVPKIDAVILTGDVVPHNIWDTNM
jgi:hypothetical protein